MVFLIAFSISTSILNRQVTTTASLRRSEDRGREMLGRTPLIFLLIARRINVLIDEVHRLAILIANVGVTRVCR